VVQFTGELVLREVLKDHTGDGRSEWASVGVLVLQDDDGSTITFGVGATTDLGSVPQFAWSFGFPPDGIGVRAYCIHDLLYRTQGSCAWTGMTWRTRAKPYSRAEADVILRKGLVACGVPTWRAWAIWAAVRVGGVGGWGH
jgi:hypothetical protein